MTSERIDRYIETLRRALKARGIVDDRLVGEARAHLVDDVDARVARGEAPDEAAREAVDRFGSPNAVADASAATHHVVFGRIVGAVSLLTMVAALYLCASVLVLRPPHGELWLPLVVNTVICLAQGLLTLYVIGRASMPLSLWFFVTLTSLVMLNEASRIAGGASRRALRGICRCDGGDDVRAGSADDHPPGAPLQAAAAVGAIFESGLAA